MGKENLIPASDPRGHKLTVAEQSAGGKKSVEIRRKKKTWKQLLEMLGDKPVRSLNNRKLLESAGIGTEDQTSDLAKMFVLDSRAQAGDMKALELEMRIRGEMAPVKNVNENYNTEVVPDVIDISGGAGDKIDNSRQKD